MQVKQEPSVYSEKDARLSVQCINPVVPKDFSTRTHFNTGTNFLQCHSMRTHQTLRLKKNLLLYVLLTPILILFTFGGVPSGEFVELHVGGLVFPFTWPSTGSGAHLPIYE